MYVCVYIYIYIFLIYILISLYIDDYNVIINKYNNLYCIIYIVLFISFFIIDFIDQELIGLWNVKVGREGLCSKKKTKKKENCFRSGAIYKKNFFFFYLFIFVLIICFPVYNWVWKLSQNSPFCCDWLWISIINFWRPPQGGRDVVPLNVGQCLQHL